MRWTIFTIAAGWLLLADASQCRAEEKVIQTPFVTLHLDAGGPGGVIVITPFVRVQVPPRGSRGMMPALPSMEKNGAKPEKLPPPLPSDDNSGEERIPPGMLPPPVPVPPSDEPASSQNTNSGQKATVQKPIVPERLPQPEPAETAPAKENAAPTAQVLSHRDFAKSFQPQPGSHTVTLLHPDTNQPVTVQFTLPSEPLRRTHVAGHEIEFKYRKQEVRIRFKHDGQARVEYRD